MRLDLLDRQDGDAEPYWFSVHERADRLPQLPCYLTWAGAEVREVITRHLHESALFGGIISGRGPRYCPSIEDKIVKFPDAERHQVFLEPEGLDTSEMYVNGVSTSLPAEVQLEFLRQMPGLEHVRMTRPGYAIEYDYFPPTQLLPTLELKGIEGLLFAGQVNGTTGYEEAAGQGIIAGINAAARALGRDPLVLRRDEAMIGVLVDDLVSRGVDEPYRMFTSRAEFRLLLRQDNAARRLLPVARRFGLLTTWEITALERRLEAEEETLSFARETAIAPAMVGTLLEAAAATPISEPVRLEQLARRPGIHLGELLALCGRADLVKHQLWADIELKYSGYLDRERDAAARLAGMDGFALPLGTPYGSFASLSFEAREKLSAVRPASLGQAARIPGVTPSDLQNLVLEVNRWRRSQAICFT